MITYNKGNVSYAIYRDYTKTSNPICISRLIEKEGYNDSLDIILREEHNDFVNMIEFFIKTKLKKETKNG